MEGTLEVREGARCMKDGAEARADEDREDGSERVIDRVAGGAAARDIDGRTEDRAAVGGADNRFDNTLARVGTPARSIRELLTEGTRAEVSGATRRPTSGHHRTLDRTGRGWGAGCAIGCAGRPRQNRRTV